MGNLALPELILIILIVVLPLVALVDILKSSFKEPVNKIVWLLVVLLVPVLGTFLYFVIGGRQRSRH